MIWWNVFWYIFDKRNDNMKPKQELKLFVLSVRKVRSQIQNYNVLHILGFSFMYLLQFSVYNK